MSQSIISLVIIVLLVVVLASSIKIIHQQKIGLVERLGKFNRRLNPGPHLLIPIIDRVQYNLCLLYTSPSPRDLSTSRMPSSA